MPHQCVRCNTFFEDGSKELLEGCSNCKGKFFFFVKKDSIEKAEKIAENLKEEDIKQMEKDVSEIIGAQFDDKPIVLDLETINVLKPGKFEIDLVDLFKGKPLVYKLEEGKYYIDIPATFKAKDLKLGKEEK